MIVVGMGYTVSNVFATHPIQMPPSPRQPAPEPSTSSAEPLFSSLEKRVADTATSLRNQLLGTTDTADQPHKVELPHQTTSGEQSVHPIVIDTVPVRPLPTVYDDIETSPAKEAILILYSHSLIQ